ncbi:hypothetical protein [Undibacterium squillarum]|uniref:hypothetical protein n=1 Tax=Undibacterium squillarum TaxID=1131567 RepID=UPI001673201E|nr:hypothetical protein [Undibacterium squillarum]
MTIAAQSAHCLPARRHQLLPARFQQAGVQHGEYNLLNDKNKKTRHLAKAGLMI